MNRTFLQGKCILVTGGTSGFGLELARLFLSEGCKVITTGRNAVKDIELKENFTFLQTDFADLENVAFAARRISALSGRVDMIINNAGVLSPSEFTLTNNGLEYSFQVNYLSHLLLDELIINERNDTEPVTIVSVTSPVYRYNKPSFKLIDKNSYRPFKSYADSKFYVLLIGEYLQNKFPEKDLRFIGFDPGTFSSGIYRMQKKWFKDLYKIAAPFMRHPSAVASNLSTILEQENLLNGAVYSRVNKFRYPEVGKNESSDKFMKECGNFLASYMR